MGILDGLFDESTENISITRTNTTNKDSQNQNNNFIQNKQQAKINLSQITINEFIEKLIKENTIRRTINEVKNIHHHGSKYQTYLDKLNRHLVEKKQNWYEKLNDDLNIRYPCHNYIVILYSDGIDSKYNCSDPLLHEIQRCTKITRDHIESIEIIKNKSKDNKPGIQVSVVDFKNFAILKNKRSWPRNAFKIGVEIDIVAPNLQIIIHNVELGVVVINDERMLLENEYGLINIQRIPDADRNETKKFKSNVKSIWHQCNKKRCTHQLA
jgi:hypothetical protein